MSLNEKLEALPKEVIKDLVIELARPNFNPPEHWQSLPYLKYDLADAIAAEIRERGIPVLTQENTLYRSLNKEPMKRIIYGFRSIPCIPDDFLKAVHDDGFGNWMEFYFAAGVWGNSELPEGYENMTMAEFVADYIRAGINRLNSEHYRRKARGIYRSDAELPFDSQIRMALNAAIGDSQVERKTVGGKVGYKRLQLELNF